MKTLLLPAMNGKLLVASVEEASALLSRLPVSPDLGVAESPVSGVINATDKVHPIVPDWMPYLRVPMGDNGPLTERALRVACDFAEWCEYRVLIHCNSGKNRSVVVASAIYVWALRGSKSHGASLRSWSLSELGRPTEPLLQVLREFEASVVSEYRG